MVINHDVVSHRRKKLNQEKHVTHVLKSLPIFILSIYENLQISLVWYCQSVSPSVRQSVSPSASTVRYRQSFSQYSTIPPVRQSVQYDTASPSVSTVRYRQSVSQYSMTHGTELILLQTFVPVVHHHYISTYEMVCAAK